MYSELPTSGLSTEVGNLEGNPWNLCLRICKQKVVFHHYTSKIVENNFYLQQIKSFQIINRLVKIVLNLWFKIFTASLALLSSGKNFALMIAKATKSKALPVQRVLCFILVSPVISSQYPHNMNSKCFGPKL